MELVSPYRTWVDSCGILSEGGRQLPPRDDNLGNMLQESAQARLLKSIQDWTKSTAYGNLPRLSRIFALLDA